MPRRLLLSGRVQGVNCRYYCSQYAKRMGIRGAASNLRDGRVEVILATDDDEKIRDYIGALGSNPENVLFFGRITGIEVAEHDGVIEGDYTF